MSYVIPGMYHMSYAMTGMSKIRSLKYNCIINFEENSTLCHK